MMYAAEPLQELALIQADRQRSRRLRPGEPDSTPRGIVAEASSGRILTDRADFVRVHGTQARQASEQPEGLPDKSRGSGASAASAPDPRNAAFQVSTLKETA